ncbi:MAG: DnaB-like helicase C-terminal domain-containing protein [Candidatus Thorarchaeota archaeon]|nr:hypothetical protein [Thermoplasmatales archaeon]
MPSKVIEKDIIRGVCKIDGFLPSLVDASVTGADFDKPLFGWVVDKSIEYYAKYNKHPTKKVLKRLVERDSELEEQEAKKYLRGIRSLYNRGPDSPHFSLCELQKFSRKKKLISYLENSAEKIEGNEDVDEVINFMTSSMMGLEALKQKEWKVVDWLDGFEDRQALRKFRKKHPELFRTFHFGIKELDAKMRRGMVIGDMGSIAAKTGRGKSIFTIQAGLQGLYQGFNVTHITTENELGQTEGRYDSRATGIPYEQIQMYDFGGSRKASLRQAQQTVDMLRNFVDTRLKIVKCIPNKTNIMTIIDILERLEKREGHKTDLLIVDSPELMIPLTQFKSDYRIQKATVYWELKSLLLERGIIGFVTSQLTRGSDDSMPTAEDMAEAYDKARLLDLMMVLIRTTKHFLSDEAMLWIVKARDFENDGQPITLHTDFSCMFMDV